MSMKHTLADHGSDDPFIIVKIPGFFRVVSAYVVVSSYSILMVDVLQGINQGRNLATLVSGDESSLTCTACTSMRASHLKEIYPFDRKALPELLAF